MLCTRQLSVTLNRRKILHGVDFSAAPGQLTCIVGPNGSGKTTLLRALTGELPFTGEALLDETPIQSLRTEELAARRAVLPQASPMAFPFTVLEVVRMGIGGGIALRADAARLPQLALERVGLRGYEGRLFQQLSGGEQQRVQLARVLVQVWKPVVGGVPRWLFLDEPVAALDIGHQLQIMRLAQDFARRGGGVIAVMHDLNLTAMVADTVCLMQDGRILAQGRVADVFTDCTLGTAYGCSLRVSTPPPNGGVFILPQAAE
ncbi:heme ABC transporter ATP-binding protein [Pararhodobacter oceanensis]|uniref:Heme ABC transporter ATP-binding protein n=1 Tax=Pararhodobacter oceanensis TaxID=2172121 RepID=A0A2T8HZ67_9RHOB|nr:heme ABC transporter ATP-binding protein [Pararhodobacter oceanensis]PVH30727.1 heme ABC transporter ATP-binding protein [Pararhodobacter oceanensis]